MMSGTLIDVAKHQGNLKYRVWEKMLEIVQYTPVILDPNTASPFHYLSEELTSVRYIEMKQHLPENPERFRAFPFILGRDGLGPGRHSWEVEVGESCLWIIGVAKGSINRNGGVAKGSMNCNGAMAEGPGEGPWCIRHSDGRYIGTSLSPTVTETPLAVRRPPRSVRVQLDWDEGELSFTDAANGTLLHTIRGLPITERLFPIFCPSQDSLPLRICTQAMLAARPTPPTLPTQPYQGCDIM
ncbi:hypothetical protein AAFF_G00299470 [Aldrovandia affinis]|uniref:B30.2/SPRY domain-containing protein n=1 Tax=Aldrovandia affinis TaxID=143900 RepID=A0AAD7W0Z8_9TELE|nr:hypothetical protein AAFF_G00299470 [Aldrovandia affinis]